MPDTDAVPISPFPDTLSTAVPPMNRTGCTPVDDHQSYAACAVTHLGSADGIRGWWLACTTPSAPTSSATTSRSSP
ncbi:hypothetical protein [Streptomyces roseifaciens]|uniref:hypothetical protein n=1 Tax=Streptomyces roseifaciens TaxID=1488406 RepID=UPI00118753D1|nr:hypothetical protein [Streptomyces roseifaciens]